MRSACCFLYFCNVGIEMPVRLATSVSVSIFLPPSAAGFAPALAPVFAPRLTPFLAPFLAPRFALFLAIECLLGSVRVAADPARVRSSLASENRETDELSKQN